MTERAAPADNPRPDTRRGSARRTLMWIAAVSLAPVIASYAVYYFFPREPAANVRASIDLSMRVAL